MNPETINAIKEALVPVAEKIGQGAEYGWEIVLRQQYVVSVGCFIISGIGMLLICLSIFLCKKAVRYESESHYDDTKFALFATSAILGVIGLTLFSVNLYSGIAHIINPAYYALEFFIELAK